ncbi:unnamed protein product [Brassicogethes aeneus]|uniref:Cytochrome P450 n=1 Tax=Brassicogethes aeneus TaxID=1431903 RepID=A0A9P0FJS1_BRAAE|nr:unnamed protein product [Brassicogethes aeneus]
MVFFGELCAAAVLGLIAIWRYVYNTKTRGLHRYPGPPTHILFGTIVDFFDRSKYLDILFNYHEKYGKVVKFQIGPFKQGLIVSDYKFLEFILSSRKTIEKSSQYTFLHNWLGQGLLTAGGDKWYKRRKVITPAFHFSILEEFIEVFESVGNVFVEKIGQEKEKFNIYPYVTLCTLDVICEAAMGVSVNAQQYNESEYVTSVKRQCRIMVKRLFSAVKSNNYLYLLTKDCKYEKNALKVLHSFTNSIIDQKLDEIKANPDLNKNNQDDGLGRKKKLAFLDLLLQCKIDGNPLTRSDLREEVDTFMFEGHDTTGSAITFLIYSLATNPEVQQKVFEEQREIFGEGDIKNVKVSHKNLLEMKYLDLVIKETLRLYPSVPFYGRELLEDIEYNGSILPKGLSIMLFAIGSHRDPDYFPEPNVFKPERFEHYDGKYNYAYIPFSAGPRNCIGQKFAILEMKSIASKVVRHFNVLSVPDHKLELNVETILISKSGVYVSLKPRDYC